MVFSLEGVRYRLPHANPAALEAAGRVFSFLGLILDFFPFFFPLLLRRVVSMVLRRSGLEPRDLALPEELEFTRSAGESAAGDELAGRTRSSWSGGGSGFDRAMAAAGRPGMAAGLDRSV